MLVCGSRNTGSSKRQRKSTKRDVREPSRKLLGPTAAKHYKHWKHGTRYRHQEAIIAMNQYFGISCNSSSFQSIPRPVQTDVRKHFGIYYVHVRNSHDPLTLINFMNSFVSPDVSLSGIRETVHGFEQVKNEILNIFKVEPPDLVGTLLSNEYRRRRNGTSYVKIDAIARGHVIVPKETEESRKQAQTIAVNGPLPAPRSSTQSSTMDPLHDGVDATDLYVREVFNTPFCEERSYDDGWDQMRERKDRDDHEQEDTTADEWSGKEGEELAPSVKLIKKRRVVLHGSLTSDGIGGSSSISEAAPLRFPSATLSLAALQLPTAIAAAEVEEHCCSAELSSLQSSDQALINGEETFAKRVGALWVGVARQEKRFEEISGLPPVDQSKKNKTDSGDGGGVVYEIGGDRVQGNEIGGDRVQGNEGGAIGADDNTSVAPDRCFQLSPFTACGDVEDEEGDEISERDTYYDDSSIHTIRGAPIGDSDAITLMSEAGITTREVFLRGELILEIGRDRKIASIRFMKFIPTA